MARRLIETALVWAGVHCDLLRAVAGGHSLVGLELAIQIGQPLDGYFPGPLGRKALRRSYV